MSKRFRAFRRKSEIFYRFDTELNRQSSLKTTDSAAAATIVAAKNETVRQPALNVQVAKAYRSGSDSKMSIKRTARRLPTWKTRDS